MKKAFIIPALFFLVCAIGSPGFAQTLTLLGSEALQIDVDNSGLPWSQTSTSLTINGSVTLGLGQTLGGGFLQAGSPFSYDWSSVTAFALTMSVSGTNPSLPFTLEFFAPDPLLGVEIVGRYQGNTAGLSTTPQLVELTEITRLDFSEIIGMQFTLDGEGTINTTLNDIQAVPEPSTWALLLLGTALFGGLAWRRRLAAVRR